MFGKIFTFGTSDEGNPMIEYHHADVPGAIEIIEVAGPNLLVTKKSYGPLAVMSYSEARRIHDYVERRIACAAAHAATHERAKP